MPSVTERLSVLETTQTADAKRLERIETKLDKLLERPTGLGAAGTGGLAALVNVLFMIGKAVVTGHPPTE